jgi:aminoglycoside 6'-N-acetyltransferase I
MDEYSICCINESTETMDRASEILLEAFLEAKMWPNINEKEASDAVKELTTEENICIGIKVDNQLIGWVGLMPRYEKTWELHPMAILPKFQKKGYGKYLLNELEKFARERGIIGIIVGSDDETNKTSLSETEINGENIFKELENIKNYKNHPYEFYKKCGFIIVGIIPNANGPKKPDILMWKDIRNEEPRGKPAGVSSLERKFIIHSPA